MKHCISLDEKTEEKLRQLQQCDVIKWNLSKLAKKQVEYFYSKYRDIILEQQRHEEAVKRAIKKYGSLEKVYEIANLNWLDDPLPEEE